MARVVIVGAGLAGAKAAEALRDRSADTEIVLVGDEPELPYERPPLSKAYLKGESPRDEAQVHPTEWYADQRIDLRTGVAATGVDTAAHTVTLADGTVLPYDTLLLATGSHARTIPLPGADADGVYTLRRVDDADRLKELLARIGRLVVIGAGWIGLEVTAAARDAGVEVTVVESAELPLVRVLGPELAQVFADLHREHGVDFRFGASIARITTTEAGTATGVELADGTTISGDAVLIAVGAAPNLDLAKAAGLTVDSGVLVDASLRTSDPDVYAVGDIAEHQHPVLGRRVRVEHWATALNQPAVAAAAMLGDEAGYDELPYFFTDQYDLGMEYIGLAEPGGYDDVAIRGDLAGREFVAFWLQDGRIVAGMNVNVWDVVDAIKALILSGAPVDRDRLTDPAVPLDQVLASLIRILYGPGGDADNAAGPLDLLDRRYWVADPGPQYVRGVMIESVDGGAALDGRSGGLGNGTDRLLFAVCRAQADVLLVGATTVRVEGYGVDRPAPELRAVRRTHRLADAPRMAIVTRDLTLRPDHPVFSDTEVRPLVLTCDDAPADRLAELAEVADVVVTGGDRVELDRALDELQIRGLSRVSCEGGPRLLGQLVAAGRLDELAVTVAPRLVSGDAPRITAGAAVRPPLPLHLHQVLADGDYLFLRYTR